ncbi:MAG TPA: ferredoxin [Croceicoccus sp.]|nr:ferredoxin [Croceicoccus sp.]
MYLCICNAIREKDFRAIAPLARGSAEDIYRQLGHEPQCRQCLDDADDILGEVRCCAA